MGEGLEGGVLIVQKKVINRKINIEGFYWGRKGPWLNGCRTHSQVGTLSKSSPWLCPTPLTFTSSPVLSIPPKQKEPPGQDSAQELNQDWNGGREEKSNQPQEGVAGFNCSSHSRGQTRWSNAAPRAGIQNPPGTPGLQTAWNSKSWYFPFFPPCTSDAFSRIPLWLFISQICASRSSLPGMVGNHQVFLQRTAQTAVVEAA